MDTKALTEKAQHEAYFVLDRLPIEKKICMSASARWGYEQGAEIGYEMGYQTPDDAQETDWGALIDVAIRDAHEVAAARFGVDNTLTDKAWEISYTAGVTTGWLLGHSERIWEGEQQ